jgi:hypothetical protein
LKLIIQVSIMVWQQFGNKKSVRPNKLYTWNKNLKDLQTNLNKIV